MPGDADAVELRVLGCLIEKQRTTPDQYPLSLNALRLACNQSTNREPVVDYDERTIKAALERMSIRGWTRFASGASSRALKYRHLLDEALGLSDAEISLLAVLMLRGPQTLGELKGRAERMHHFGSLEDVEATLDGLAGRELAARVARRPGQKEDRYAQRSAAGRRRSRNRLSRRLRRTSTGCPPSSGGSTSSSARSRSLRNVSGVKESIRPTRTGRSMLSIQAILVTSSLLIIVGMLASVAWLSALRRSAEPVPVEPVSEHI